MTFLAAGLTGTVWAGGSTNSSTISDVEPGLLGFIVVASLGVALVFLLRSMNKQFRKIGPRPQEPGSAAAGELSREEASAADINAAAGISPAQADTDRAAIIAEATATGPGTGAGFVPDTGRPSGRGGRP